MDVFEIVEQLKELLNKFPNLDYSEMTKLKALSNILNVECNCALYDWGK